MQYRVALDPELELSVSEFTGAWNEGPFTEDAPATLSTSPAETFLSPEMTAVLITAAVSIPTTVIANFVSELLKKKFIDKPEPQISVTVINLPDGQPLWVIKRLK
jgi:hypothetical protein